MRKADALPLQGRIMGTDVPARERLPARRTWRGSLMELMREAGFGGVRRLDGAFYQPLVIGSNPPR